MEHEVIRWTIIIGVVLFAIVFAFIFAMWFSLEKKTSDMRKEMWEYRAKMYKVKQEQARRDAEDLSIK